MADPLPRLTTALSDRYRIERELGAGGMATVYLAEDIRHRRRVAVKVLRPELAAMIGAERFLKEIEVTANLQHPHILPLHDSGEADHFLYYVMPYVEGETLRARIQREKQLRIEDAVAIATGVASALDYAHRHGIVHRDIKPENILLHDGQPLIADFGIALAVSQAGGSRLTETGLSLGTPHYMSPEQAMGDRELDARSDIYSLGAVLYELLAGDPPYTGSTAQAIVAKVITEKAPPVTALRETVPPHVAAALAKALSKLPADRFTTAAQFAEALAHRVPGVTLELATARETAAAGRGATRIARHPALPWVLLAVALVVAGVLGARLDRSQGGGGNVVRAILELPPEARLGYPHIVLSRDGRRLVIAAVQGDTSLLLQRELNRLSFTAVPGSGSTNGRVFLSPDGTWAATVARRRLIKFPLAGGPATELAEANWGGGDWTADGNIVYSVNYRSGLWRVPAAGGKPEQLTAPDSASGELAHWWPQVLPDGDHVVFTAFRTPIGRSTIEVLSLRSGARTVLLTGGVSGRYLPTGHLVYARNEALFAVSFDPSALAVRGEAVPVLQDLALATQDGRAAFSVADNGTLAYLAASTMTPDLDPVWVARTGEESAPVLPPARYADPAISPDGGRLALAVTAPGETRDVWVFDLARGTRSPVTTGGANDFEPEWTPGGERIAFVSEQPIFQLHWRPADGSAPAAPLFESPFDKHATTFTPDAGLVLFYTATEPRSEIWSLPMSSEGKPATVLASPTEDFVRPRLSPDGRWLAYVGNGTGRGEVYVSPFPRVTTGRRQVSVGGGSEPHWTRGGRELVYRSGSRMMAVSVDPVTGALGAPALLFDRRYDLSGDASYDVTADGGRFLMLRPPAAGPPRKIVIVTNWFDELRALMAGRQ
jgi:serine/threonine-protein kinase